MQTVSTHKEQQHKKRHYTRNKVGFAQQRVTCTVCLKPGAVWYYADKTHNKIIYEHRDEPPIKEFEYRGSHYKRYRRCHTGASKENPIDSILSTGALKPRADNILTSNEPDWRTMYFEMKSKADAMHRLLKGADEIWGS